MLLVAGVLAAWAIRPQAYSGLHQDEIDSFVKGSYLEQEPREVIGTLLDGSIKAIATARTVNRRKAKRLGIGFRVFLVAVAVTAAAGGTVAVEGATNDRREPAKPSTPRRSAEPTASGSTWARRATRLPTAEDGAGPAWVGHG